MSASTFDNQSLTLARTRMDWSAIWAGVFTFIGIWSVFGLLGAAILAPATSSNAAHAAAGMGIGMSIWAIVLTIIAMYVAARETGRLAAASSRHEGVTHGMVMFGLSVVAALVMAVLGGNILGGGAAGTSAHTPYILELISGMGWVGFICLFLGWLAAMLGAGTGARGKAEKEMNVEAIRKVA